MLNSYNILLNEPGQSPLSELWNETKKTLTLDFLCTQYETVRTLELTNQTLRPKQLKSLLKKYNKPLSAPTLSEAARFSHLQLNEPKMMEDKYSGTSSSEESSSNFLYKERSNIPNDEISSTTRNLRKRTQKQLSTTPHQLNSSESNSGDDTYCTLTSDDEFVDSGIPSRKKNRKNSYENDRTYKPHIKNRKNELDKTY